MSAAAAGQLDSEQVERGQLLEANLGQDGAQTPARGRDDHQDGSGWSAYGDHETG